MRKISKKTIKRISEGYHDDLMESIEFLIDTYNEDKFNAGYASCMEDMSVRSYRLAEYIQDKYTSYQDKMYEMDTDECAKLIEEYFTNALKEE